MVACLLYLLIYDLDNRISAEVRRLFNSYTRIDHSSPVTKTVRRITYRELRDQVAKFAGVLRNLGVQPGDRGVIHMPMIFEGVIAMLATARLGAVHSVAFGGLPAEPLAIQIDQVRPKVIVSASCGYEYNEVIDYMPSLMAAIGMLHHKPNTCVIFQRPQKPATIDAKLAVDWHDAMAGAAPVDCVAVAATAPLYILFTSGSTASQPKGKVGYCRWPQFTLPGSARLTPVRQGLRYSRQGRADTNGCSRVHICVTHYTRPDRRGGRDGRAVPQP